MKGTKGFSYHFLVLSYQSKIIFNEISFKNERISSPHSVSGSNALLEPVCQSVVNEVTASPDDLKPTSSPLSSVAGSRAVLALAVTPVGSMTLNRCLGLGRLNGVLLET